jgi:hypothetical protein
MIAGNRVMGSSAASELDMIEELRLRRWARENYVPSDKRHTTWHPVVLDEMAKKDHESSDVEPHYTLA